MILHDAAQREEMEDAMIDIRDAFRYFAVFTIERLEQRRLHWML